MIAVFYNTDVGKQEVFSNIDEFRMDEFYSLFVIGDETRALAKNNYQLIKVLKEKTGEEE